MATYRLEITYAQGGDEPQVHTGLDADRAEMGAGAFLRDLIALEGKGVTKMTVTVEPHNEREL